MIEEDNFSVGRTRNTTEIKIANAKKKIATVKAIEKLEKEVARLEKNIATKKAKIEELANDL